MIGPTIGMNDKYDKNVLVKRFETKNSPIIVARYANKNELARAR